MAITRYNIGDHIYASCYSDFDFEVEVEIMAISSFRHANEYEDILRKMFNSENGQVNYENLKSNTTYYYICRVLRDTFLYKVDDTIVLTDSLIKENESYHIQQKATIVIDLSFNAANTVYRTPNEIAAEIKALLTSKGVETNVAVGKTIEQKNAEEMIELRSLVNNFKSLKTVESIVDKILQLQDPTTGGN